MGSFARLRDMKASSQAATDFKMMPDQAATVDNWGESRASNNLQGTDSQALMSRTDGMQVQAQSNQFLIRNTRRKKYKRRLGSQKNKALAGVA